MHRATPVNTSFRSYVAGGARCLIDKADDTQEMQEAKASFMKAEVREKVECPQNYGFTSLVVEAEKGDDGQIDKCSEGFSQFMGGNRTFPVVEVMDDRRFRLRNFKEGEAAVYDDQQQKVHIQRNRIFTRSQYKIEMRVINDQSKMKGHGKDQEADRDQYPYPDPMPDHSRRWSTYVMDKDTITIERTDIDDAKDTDSKQQDQPESKDGACDKHIKMLSRVFLDKYHVHVLTPNISILWDEEKRMLVLNTEKTSITMQDKEDDQDSPKITIQTTNTSVTMQDKQDNADNPKITIMTPKASVTIDDKLQYIKSSTANTDVVLNEQIKKVQVGDKTASIPAAKLGSITSDGAVIVGNVCKKVLVI
jgi:phage gp45-like